MKLFVRSLRNKRPIQKKAHRRLFLEALEDRRLLATYVVDSLFDSDADTSTTLREAVQLANQNPDSDVIRFAKDLLTTSGQRATIELDDGPIVVSNSVVIYGPGSELLAVDGNDNGAVFFVQSGNVTITGLEITGGSESGVVNFPGSDLTLVDTVIRGNSTTYDPNRGFEGGGGIHNAGDLTVRGSTISHNVALGNRVFPFGRGGGISSTFGSLDIQDSLIFDNAAEGDGGGIYLANDQEASITNVTVSGNTARLHGGGIAAFDGPVDLNHVTITGNNAADLGWEGRTGGGLVIGTDLLTMTNTLIAGNLSGRDSTSTGQPLRSSDVEYLQDTSYRDRPAGSDAPNEGLDRGPLGIGRNNITGRLEAEIDDFDRSGDLLDRFLVTVPAGMVVTQFDVTITGLQHGIGLYASFVTQDTDLRFAVNEPETRSRTFDDEDVLTAGEYMLDFTFGGDYDRGFTVSHFNYDLTIVTELVSAPDVPSAGNLIGDPVTSAWFENGVNHNIVGDGLGGELPIDRILDVVLRDRGGVTRLHPLSPNSPAIDAGVAQGATGPQTDQRGFPYRRSVLNAELDAFSAGIPDIGAFELQTPPLLMVESVSGTTVWEFMGTSAGGTIDMNVEGVEFSVFIPAGRTSRETVDSLAAAIRGDETLSRMGIDAATDTIRSNDPGAPGEKSILITTGAITSFAVSDSAWTHALRRLQSPPAVLEVSNFRDDNDGNFSAGDLSLREAVALANARPDHSIIRFSQDLLDVPIVVTAGELSIDWDTTILGQGIGSTLVDAKQSNRIFNVTLPARVAMSELTLTGGKVTGGAFGGGALVNHGDLTLRRVEVAANEAVDVNGGGIANYGTLVIQESTLIGNRTNDHGGGLYNHDKAQATIGPFVRVTENKVGLFGGGLHLRGTVTVENSLIDRNNAVEQSGDNTAFFGGGIHIDSEPGLVTQVEIRTSYISENEAIVGGGISVVDSGTTQVSVVESTIDGNIAKAGSSDSLMALGGGINAFLDGAASELEIIGTTVSNNKATRSFEAEARGGGLHLSLGGSLHTIANTTISGNEADQLGGGVFVADHSVIPGNEVPIQILNATITNNEAQYGAGLFLDGDIFSLVDSILLNNTDIISGSKRDLHEQKSAISEGSRFGPLAGNGQMGNVSNNLIHWIRQEIGNSKVDSIDFRQLDSRNYVIAPADCIVYGHGSTLEEVLACDAEVEAGAAEAATQIAALGPLANNGGPTLTHKLRPNSKAIDAGSSRGWRRFNPVDQRGFPRTDSPGIANEKLATSAFGVPIGSDVGAFEAPIIEVRNWESETLNSAGGTSVSQFDHSETADGTPGDPSAFGFGFTAPSIPTEPQFLGLDYDPEPWSFGAIEEGDLGDEYGAEISVDIDTRFGFEYGYYLDTGSVVANYEGLLRYTTEKNGNKFTIDTGNSIDVGALYTVSPRLGAYVDLVAEFAAVIEGRACFIGCVGGRLPITIDESLPLLSINRQEVVDDVPQVENGNAVLDGDIKLLGVSIDDAFSDFLADKYADEIKKSQTAKRNAEINKQRAESTLARETDPAKRAAAQNRLNVANNDIKAADESIKDKKKKKKNAQDLCIGQFIRGCINETDGGLLGIEASLEAGLGVDGIGSVSKPLGSLAISMPEVQLTDTELDDHSGKLSASTDDFLPGSEEDIRRNLAKLNVDVAGLLGPIVGLPLGRYEASVGPLTFGVTTLSYEVEPRLNVTQDVSLQPFFDTNDRLRNRSVNHHGVKFEFTNSAGNPVEVAATVDGTRWTDSIGDPNRVTEVWFRPGSIIEIDTAGNDVQITPHVRLGHKFDNNVGLEIDIKGRLEALALSVSAFGETFIDIGPLLKHEHDLGTFDLGSVIAEDDLLLSTSLNATEKIILDASAADTETAILDGTQPGNAIESELGEAVGVEAAANSSRHFSLELIDENGAALESVDIKLVNASGNPISGSTLNVPSGVTVTANSDGWTLSGFDPGLGDEILISVRFQNGAPAGSSFTPTGVLPTVEPVIVQRVTAERLLDVQNNPQVNQIAVDTDMQVDIDNDGVLSANTDYVLIERFIKSHNGGLAFSIENAVAANAERTTPNDIQSHLSGLLDAGRLDANGDELVDDDDITLFARYFFGLTTQLPGGDPDGTRTDGDAVDSFIAGEVKSPGVDEFTARAEAMAAEAGLTVRRGAGDHFGMKEAFQVDDAAVAGSSAWNPIKVDGVDGEFTFSLTTFRTPVVYQDTLVEYTPEGGSTQQLFVATGPVGTPPKVLPDASQLVGLATARGDAFREQLSRTLITKPTRTAALGVHIDGEVSSSAAVFVRLPDSAGYNFTSNFPITDLVFDPTAGMDSASIDSSVMGSSALNHDQDVDGTDIDFDVFVPGQGWFEVSMDQPFAFPSQVTSFELYPRSLPNASLHRIGNLARPQIEMAVGLVFDDTDAADTPTVVAESVGPREAVVQPEALGRDLAGATKYQVQRNGVGIEVQQDGSTAALIAPNVNTEDPDDVLVVTDYPAASLFQLQLFGSSTGSDELVIDNTNGPISVPILFDAQNSPGAGSGGDPASDVVTVKGSGMVLDIVSQVELRGVERIDIRGNGSNTLIVDEASLLHNGSFSGSFPVTSKFINVSADADDVVLGLEGWTLTTTAQGDRYESPSGAVVVQLPSGTQIAVPQQAAVSPTQQSLHASGDSQVPTRDVGANNASSATQQTVRSQQPSEAQLQPSRLPTGPFQRVDANAPSRPVSVEGELTIDLNYSLGNPAAHLPELLGLRVHYDSTMLQLSDAATNLFMDGLIGSEDLPEKAADGDIRTDRAVVFGWADTQGAWTPTAQTLLAKLSFSALAETGTTTIRLTGDTAVGYEFVGEPLTITITPKSLVVDSLDDTPTAGETTLREAIEAANSNPGVDIITFSPTLTASGSATLMITRGDVVIDDPVSILGPGREMLTVTAQGNSRIFDITTTAGDVTIQDLTLTGGQTPAGESGGAIRSATSGTLSILSSTISGSSAGKDGGAIFSQGGLSIVNSTVAGNTATNGGGGIAQRDTTGVAEITASTLSGNNAAFGGAFMNLNATASIVNSTVSGNSTTSLGGGIVNVSDEPGNEAHLLILQSTITQNITGAGGAVHSGTQRGATFAEIKIGNTLVVQQVAGNNVTLFNQANSSGATVTSLGHNLVDGNSIPLNATGDRTDISGSVVETVLQDNGGSTKTHALLAGSPAIDAGDSSLVPMNISTDQRGRVRIVGSSVDSGAFEFGTATPSTLSIAATSASKNEGNTGTTSFTFTVTRSGSDLSGTTIVSYAVIGSGANPATAMDFAGNTLPTGSVVLAANETSKVITIPVQGDTTVESHEGFTVTLSNPIGSTISTATAFGTITNDDSLPTAPTVTLAVNQAYIAEDAGVARFTATLSAATNQPVTIQLGFSGTATLTSDYTRSGTQIVIPAGQTTGSITVTAAQDTLVEGTETVVVDITNVTNGTESGTQQATTAILEGDVPKDAIVAFTLAVTDLYRNPLPNNQIAAGQEFTLNAFATDLRDDPRGVFAGYLDVAYTNPGAFSVIASERQRLVFSDATTGGSFWVTFDGITAEPIPFSTNLDNVADDLRHALENHPAIGAGNVRVVASQLTYPFDFPGEFYFDITFINDMAEMNVSTLEVDWSSLVVTSGSPQVKVEVIANGNRTDAEWFRNAFSAGPHYGAGLNAEDGDKNPNTDELLDPNVFSEVGTFARNSYELGRGPLLLWSVDLLANETGTVDFVGNAADIDPDHDILVFGKDDYVPTFQVAYGATQITIVDSGLLQPGETQVTLEDGNVVTRFGGNVMNQVSRQNVSELRFQGGSGDETLAINDLGRIDGQPVAIHFDGHDGTDTFRLLGSGQVVDISASGDTVLQNVEILDIKGSGNNRLTLDLDAVLNLSTSTDTLRVQHDDGDTIEYGGGWKAEIPQVIDGQFVHILKQQNATVEVDNARAFQNPLLALDTNRDGSVAPIDALIIINRLNTTGPGVLSAPVSESGLGNFFYYDPSGDRSIAPIDVLLVVNFLIDTAFNAEGELSVLPFLGDTFSNPSEYDTNTIEVKQSDCEGGLLDSASVTPTAMSVAAEGTSRSRIEKRNATNETDHDLFATLDAFFADF